MAVFICIWVEKARGWLFHLKSWLCVFTRYAACASEADTCISLKLENFDCHSKHILHHLDHKLSLIRNFANVQLD